MTIELTEGDRAKLSRWVKSRAVSDKQRLRARIVLMPEQIGGTMKRLYPHQPEQRVSHETIYNAL